MIHCEKGCVKIVGECEDVLFELGMGIRHLRKAMADTMGAEDADAALNSVIEFAKMSEEEIKALGKKAVESLNASGSEDSKPRVRLEDVLGVSDAIEASARRVVENLEKSGVVDEIARRIIAALDEGEVKNEQR